MTFAPRPVSSYLSASPHAQVLAQCDLGFGRQATLWRNRDSQIRYDAPDGHTISLYARGGLGTLRLDPGRAPRQGHTGAICTLPQGQPSEWRITESFDFLHLHIPDDELRRSFALTCDRDARLFQLAELTYVDAPTMAAPLHALLQAVQQHDRLAAECATTEVLAALFQGGPPGTGTTDWGQSWRPVLGGGLSLRHMTRIRDHIEANLHDQIRLEDLAALVGLSPFHLQRSFRASAGISPQRWIAARRVMRAQGLLARNLPLLRIAMDCGYDSQSHFTRSFKAATGLTPGRYRAEITGKSQP